MVFPSFLPLIESPDSSLDLLSALIRIGPILVPAEHVSAIQEQLSSSAASKGGLEIFTRARGNESADEISALLSSGAKAIGLTLKHLQSLGDNAGIPRSKIVLRLSESEAATCLESSSLQGLAGMTIVCKSALLGTEQVKSIRKQLVPPGLVYLELPTAHKIDAELIRQVNSLHTILVVPSSSLTTTLVPQLFLSTLHSDRPDSLIPTIVSSWPSTASLGLVYSSSESIAESILTGRGVYQSRKHGLWRKGETSGSTQQVVKIQKDCDNDSLLFQVIQNGSGFCHEGTETCFSPSTTTTTPSGLKGITALEQTLKSRLQSSPPGSYTSRLFNDHKLLSSKIMEEAEELITAKTPSEIAFEMADLLYFAMVRCIQGGVDWEDVERSLDEKAEKGKRGIRRPGNAKEKYVDRVEEIARENQVNGPGKLSEEVKVPKEQIQEGSTQDMPVPKEFPSANGTEEHDPMIRMRSSVLSETSPAERASLLRRPVLDSLAMIERVKPIVQKVRQEGDEAVLSFTRQFDRVSVPMDSNVLLPPFYQPSSSQSELPESIRLAIDQAYANVRAFHLGQAEKKPLVVETMPGVVCTRFARPIDRVGIYVPGGTAILPSTALMLGVPAQVAGCSTIVLATPPRQDGSISPEVLYVAELVGVSVILKAGGAQAVAAMAYGTKQCPKVDKIFGPGNQWVTAAKMLVQNDTEALVGIDMPAGPSEVMVIADKTANPVFVASDLLSQAEHGIDSQVVLVAIDLPAKQLQAIEIEVDKQAKALPRVDIIKQAIKKSLIVQVKDLKEAMGFSNEYAPEHLILHLEDAPGAVKFVNNAGSVFVGPYSPESCGDYASGTNHTLPTYGYARQFSGVNTLSFQKHITSQELTKEGLGKLGPIVVTLAECEGLEAHANAVRVRLAALEAAI